jgi:hypothetical protein
LRSADPLLPLFTDSCMSRGSSSCYTKGEADVPQGLNSLLKNSFRSPAFPSAAKAVADFAGLTARLEAAPFQSGRTTRVFQHTAKPACLLVLGGTAEAVPFPNPIYEMALPCAFSVAKSSKQGAVAEMPCGAAAGAVGLGILRLRRSIREANRPAPLRMTELQTI